MATGRLAPRDALPVPVRGRAVLHNRVGRLERLVDAVGLRRRRLDRAAFAPDDGGCGDRCHVPHGVIQASYTTMVDAQWPWFVSLGRLKDLECPETGPSTSARRRQIRPRRQQGPTSGGPLRHRTRREQRGERRANFDRHARRSAATDPQTANFPPVVLPRSFWVRTGVILVNI